MTRNHELGTVNNVWVVLWITATFMWTIRGAHRLSTSTSFTHSVVR
jgi:hypothetical protein